jgi:hypothetical protein
MSPEEFSRRCLKPDPNRMGSWTARRWGRPAALRITRIVAPYGWSANSVTLAACCCAAFACACLAWGGRWSLLTGCLLLQLWYVLDHVDGQLARLRGTASLDGAAWDYLMHHGVQLIVPQTLGFGLFRETGSTAFLLAGAVWGWSTLLIGLRHDVRYKAFVQRLKRVHGELRIVGGGGERPQPGGLPQPTWRSRIAWLVMKVYETHVVVGVLTALAIIHCFVASSGDGLLIIYVSAMALPAPFVAVYLIAKMVRGGQAEREFSLWFRVPEGAELSFRDGWWHVEWPADSERREG